MAPKTQWMIYGANGYTGRLIAEQAARRGMQPIVAGRNRAAIDALGSQLGCQRRVFDLQELAAVHSHLADCRLVLNCAGPFSATAAPMIAAALAAGAHYLDITGEINCIEHAHARHADAIAAHVALIPAVGFDVVPSDCLAAQAAARVEAPERLLLAMRPEGQLSRGTAKTMIEALPRGGRARIEGRIERVPIAWKVRKVPFPDGEHWTMTIPWGDVSAAYYSTGIANIETYVAQPKRVIRWIKRLRFLAPLAGFKFVQSQLRNRVDKQQPGPSEQQRSKGRVSLWARVEGAGGQAVEATLITPDGYTTTVQTSLAAVEQVLAQAPAAGFSTPSRAFGAHFIDRFPEMRIGFR